MNGTTRAATTEEAEQLREHDRDQARLAREQEAATRTGGLASKQLGTERGKSGAWQKSSAMADRPPRG